jgi:hypothetical protein
MPCSIIADRHHFREAGAAVDGEWPAKQHCLRWPRVRRHAWLGRKRIMTSSPVAFADLVKDGSAASSRPASTSLQFRLDLHRFSPERSAASVRARSSNVQRHDAGRCPRGSGFKPPVPGMDICVIARPLRSPGPRAAYSSRHLSTKGLARSNPCLITPVPSVIRLASRLRRPVSNGDQKPGGRPQWQCCSLRDPIP